MAIVPKHMRRFAKDERGNFALTFAVGTTVVIGIIGASMDFSLASTATKRSQQIADAVALNGAVFIRNNGYTPTSLEEGGVPAGRHTAADLNYKYGDFVRNGAGGVNVDVVYDDKAKEVRVAVSGQTDTTFTRVLGHDTVDFSTTATVSYMNIEDAHPASIALVLDNSGSMAWDDRIANSDGTSPAGARERIHGLKKSVKTFRRDLNKRLGPQKAKDHRVLRMGMLPYSSDTIHKGVVPMRWGYVKNSEVNAMSASGSTNSNPPMATALEWMKKEDKAHADEAKRKAEPDAREPLKFVILMSDGENTVGGWEFYPNDKAPVYWKVGPNGWSGVWAWAYNPTTHVGYERGDLRRDTDRLTLESCKALKEEENVEIFTIGYALQEGAYNMRIPSEKKKTYYVNAWTRANAWNLLQTCSSSDKHFIWAKNADELEAAFNRIQNSIVEELIRIKS